MLVDRSGLADRLNGNGGPAIVEVERERVVVDGTGLDAICSGPAVRIGFTPALLAAALADGVGPDVLLEIGPSSRPVAVRSADQGTFSTLVMPVRLDA